MASEFVIKEVKKIIVSGLKKYADEINSSLNKVGLIFYTKEKDGTPLIRLMNEGKVVRETTFKEMAEKVTIPFLFRAAFSLEKDMPKWIQKFLVKCALDTGADILTATYIMRYRDEDKDLHANMYVNWKLFPSDEDNEVPIEYILTVND